MNYVINQLLLAVKSSARHHLFKKAIFSPMAAKTAKTSVKQKANSQNSFIKQHLYTIIVVAVTLLLYANSLSNSYNLDDELVTRNHRLTSKGISAIPQIFTSPYYEDGAGYSYEYRPVVLASFAIEHQLFGDNPLVSHFFNVLLYALICVLLLHLLQKVLCHFPPIIPIAITLLYVAHTSHTEVVCSIKNRDELLALGFSLLSLAIALKVTTSNKLILALIIPVLFTLSLMSKLTTLSFAIIIPMCLLFFTNVNLLQFSIISLLLVLPLYWLLNVHTGFERLKIIAGLTSINYAAYGLKYAATYYQQSKNWLLLLKHKLPGGKAITALSPIENSGVKNFFKDIIPPATYFSLKYTLVAPVFVGLYLICVHQGYYLISLAGLLFLLYYKWKGNEAESWWASTCILFCLSLNIFAAQKTNFTYSYYYNIYIAFIAISLYHERRKLFIPSLICILLFLYLQTSLTQFFSALAFIMGWSITTHRYGRYAGFVIIISLLAIKYPYNSLPQAVGIIIQLVYNLALTLTYHYKKGLSQLFVVFALIAALIFHISHASFTPQDSIQKTIQTIATVSNNATPQLVEKKQDRPLHFVEVCISLTDPISKRLGTSFEILFYYLKNVVVPYPLSFYYGYKFIKPMEITDILPLISLTLHLLIFIAALYLVKKQPIISFGLLTYLISIAVFSNYQQQVPGMLADRFLLVPSLGWCMVLVGIVAFFYKLPDSENLSWSAIPAHARYILTGVLVFYSGLTFARNFKWHDDLTLFRNDIEYVNESSQAHNLLALHIMQHIQNETDPAVANKFMQEALTHFKKAQEIYPNVFNVAYDIGRVYNALNKPDSALASFQFALTIDTTYATLYSNIADIYFNRGDYNDALIYLKKYVRDAPYEFDGYNKMGYIYYQQKKYAESIAISKLALQKLPGTLDACVNIGRVYMETNNVDSALHYLREANKLSPGNPGVVNSIQQLELKQKKGS
jgi:tetratricopeptide (TPR) repeat protein